MQIHGFVTLIFVIFSCIFSGIVAIDIVIKNRRASWLYKINHRTRKEMLDELDQKEWERKLDKEYSTFPSWYML